MSHVLYCALVNNLRLWYEDSAGNTVEEKSLVFFPNPNVLVAFGALTLLVGRQEGHPACNKYGGSWRWALVTSPHGVTPIQMVGVSASVKTVVVVVWQ